MATALNLSNSAYHANPAIGNSKLTAFLDNPELFHAREIAKTLPQRKATKDMLFGTMLHEAVLLGAKVTNFLSYAEYAALAPGEQTKLTNAVIDHMDNMVDAVWSHPRASVLLARDNAVFEQCIFWTDPETGLELKSMQDCRRPAGTLIVDLKSTADASRSGFAKAMHNYGYYRQVVFYKMAAEELTGQPHDFVFVAVEKAPPYRVRCYELDPTPDKALTKAYEDVRSGLEQLARAFRENDWHEPGWDQVLTLDLPAWAYKNQWEMSE